MRAEPGPIWIGQVELGRTLPPSGAARDRRPDDVRLHGQVLGFVSLPLHAGEISRQTVTDAVRTQLAAALARHLQADWLPGGDGPAWTSRQAWKACRLRSRAGSAPRLSVVVCTRNRPEMLATCLASLLGLEYGPFEVVVVDNAPSTGASLDCFARMVGGDARFRYVREAAPGLSRARNRGMAEATAPYVAFTDDDVQVDRWWLHGIAAGFARDHTAACVTGLVSPAELDQSEQRYFDRRFSWARRIDPGVYSMASRDGLSSLYPYSAGHLGTGANFAVDRALMTSIGGFDEALGAGSPARGGEDLDAFVRILRAGRSVVYEPSAIVWHVHRGDPRALKRQLFAYGEGLTAFLTKHLVATGTAREILRRAPEGARQALRMWSSAAINGRAPAVLVLTEVSGMVAGPLAYAWGRGRLGRGRLGRGQSWPRARWCARR